MEMQEGPSTFDQKPICTNMNINQTLSQYPPGFNESDFIEIQKKPEPLSKRVHSKVWKIRKEAFQQLLIQVKENPKVYQQFALSTGKFLTDPNQMCLQKAIKIVDIYMQQTQQSPILIKDLLKIIIQKCLTIQKPQIQTCSQDIVFWAMDNKEQESLFVLINQNLLHKNPKIVGVAIDLLTLLINNYGIKRMDNLDYFSKHLSHFSNGGRIMAKNNLVALFKEIFIWMGDYTFQFNIHPQVKQQVKRFSKNFIREQLVIKRGFAEKKLIKIENNMDNMLQEQSAQPIDVLGNYDIRWVEKVLSLQKWKQKKQLLDQFIKKTKMAPIFPRQVSHYITLIKRLLVDNNINILLCGLKIVANLSKGLKRHFSHPAKACINILFSKLKDKKQTIVDQAHKAISCTIKSLLFEDIFQEIKQGLQDKSPNMRTQCLKVLHLYIGKKDPKILNSVKCFIAKLQKLTQDGNVEVRQTALSTLCRIKQFYGMQFFGDKLRNLPPSKLQIIQRQKSDDIQIHAEKMDIQPIIVEKKPILKQIKQNKIFKQNYPQNKELQATKEVKQLKDYRQVRQPKQYNQFKEHKQIKQSVKNNFSLKTTLNLMQSILPRMSNPIQSHKLQSADKVLQYLYEIPRPVTETQLTNYAELLNQLTNVIKCRLQQNNLQITNRYIQVTKEMIIKGLFTKVKIRILLPIIIRRMHETNCFNPLTELLIWNGTYVFSFFPMQLTKDKTCQQLIDFIFLHNEQFIQKAKLQLFIHPLLACISSKICLEKVQRLLDQIVQVLGQSLLEKIAKESKLYDIEQYLSKWNICYIASHSQQPQINQNQSQQPVLVFSKMQRIRNEIQNPWPITPSSSHIIKLITQMTLIGQPINILATPINLNKQHINILRSMSLQYANQWSDILIKWIFWKLQVQKPHIIIQILQFCKKIVHHMPLQECQVIILLGGLMNCLEVSKQSLNHICSFLLILNQHWKQKSFRFWVNSFSDPSIPIDQILYILIHCYADLISEQLVTLARIPAILKCTQFINFLKSNYDAQLLKVYGFNFSNQPQTQILLKSKTLINDKLTQNQKQFYLDLFQRSGSNDVIAHIQQYTQNLSGDVAMQVHLKIMNSIITPYLRKQLSLINIFNYFHFFLRKLNQLTIPPYLLNLTRTLIFFLIDLDEVKPQNSKQLLSRVNKILLLLFEESSPMHMLQVLFLMLRDQLKVNDSMKLNHLIPKCIAKVVKSSLFRENAKQCVKYIINEIHEIIALFDIGIDSTIIKQFKTIFQEVITLYRITLKNHLQSFNKENLQTNEAFQSIIQQILEKNEIIPTNKRENQMNTLKTLQQQGNIIRKKIIDS